MLNNEFQISSVNVQWTTDIKAITTTHPLYYNSVVLSYMAFFKIINMHTSMYIILFALTEAAMIKWMIKKMIKWWLTFATLGSSLESMLWNSWTVRVLALVADAEWKFVTRVLRASSRSVYFRDRGYSFRFKHRSTLYTDSGHLTDSQGEIN